MKENIMVTFTDSDLYTNMVLEAKKTKSLSKLVKKCLSAYYYYDDVRELVDFYEEGDGIVERQAIEREKFNDELSDIKDSLATLDVYLKDLDNVVGTGLEEFSQYAKQRAELTSGSGAEETEYGLSLIQLGDVKKEAEHIGETAQTQKVEKLENELSELKDMMKQLMGSSVGVQPQVVQPTQPYQVQPMVQQPIMQQEVVQTQPIVQQPVAQVQPTVQPMVQPQQVVQQEVVAQSIVQPQQVVQQPQPTVQQEVVAQPIVQPQPTVQQEVVAQPIVQQPQQVVQPQATVQQEQAPQEPIKSNTSSNELLNNLLNSGIGFKF